MLFTSNCHSNIEERMQSFEIFRKFIFQFVTCLPYYSKNKARSCLSHNNLNRHSDIILFKLYSAVFPKLENKSWEWENYKNANLEKKKSK